MTVLSQEKSADLGPLAWCFGEIRHSLKLAEGSLQKYRNGREALALNSSRTAIHQANGALRIVSVAGVSKLLEESEQQISDALASGVELAAESVAAIEHTCRAVIEYLSDLLEGQSQQPVLLYPQYKALLDARNAERNHPADLFFPDLRVQIRRNLNGIAPTSEQVGEARAVFERALLAHLRDSQQQAALNDMAGSIELIARAKVDDHHSTFWTVLSALFAGLKNGSVVADIYAKRVLTKVNLQVRRMIIDGVAPQEQVLVDVLFLLARADNSDPTVAAVRSAFKLEGQVPENFDSLVYGRIDIVQLDQAKASAVLARQKWESFVDGQKEELSAYLQAAGALNNALINLPSRGIVAIGQSLLHAGKKSIDNAPEDTAAIEVAIAILYLEHVLESGARLSAADDKRAQTVAQRLHAVLDGANVSGETPAWLRAVAQRAQEKQTFKQFVVEVQANLQEVESSLDSFFRDPTDNASLPKMSQQMTQVGSVLFVLGFEQASLGSSAVASQITQLIDQPDPNPDLHISIASSVGVLGMFVESVLRNDGFSDRCRFDPATKLFYAAEVEAHSGSPEIVVIESADIAPAQQSFQAPVVPVNQILAPAFVSDVDPIVESMRDADEEISTALLQNDAEAPRPADFVAFGDEPLAFATESVEIQELQGLLDDPVDASVPAFVDEPEWTELSIDDVITESMSDEVFAPVVEDSVNRIEEQAFSVVEESSDFESIGELVEVGDFALEGFASSSPVAFAPSQQEPISLPVERGTNFSSLTIPAFTEGMAARSLVSPPSYSPPTSKPELQLPADNFPYESPKEVAGKVEAPAQAQLEIQSESETIDPEILEIFLLEAQEVLETIGDSLEQLKSQSGQEELLVVVRRGFHTLKGSGRMVGLTAFGEAGWAMEQTMNLWLGEKRAASKDLLDLIELSLVRFAQWIAEISASAAVQIEPDSLIRAASNLRELGELTISDRSNLLGTTESAVMETEGWAEASLVDEQLLATTELVDAVDFVEIQNEPTLLLEEPTSSQTLISLDIADSDFDLDVFQQESIAELPKPEVEIPMLAAATSAVAASAVAASAAAVVLVEPPVELGFEEATEAVVESNLVEPTKVAEAELVEAQIAAPSSELREIFLAEADELLQIVMDQALRWQSDTEERASDQVKRAVHSLAGSSAIMGLIQVHEMSVSLEHFLQSQMTLNQKMNAADADDFLYSTDALAGMLHQFASGVPVADRAAEVSRAKALAKRWSELSTSEFAEQQAFEEKSFGSTPSSLMAAVAEEAANPLPKLTNSVVHTAQISSDELDPDLAPIFVAEAMDLLPEVGDSLRKWSDTPSDGAVAKLLMRQLHTIKGSARMAGAMRLGQLVHEMESKVEAAVALPSAPPILIDELQTQYDAALNMFEVIRDPALASSQAHVRHVDLPPQMDFETGVLAPASSSLAGMLAAPSALLNSGSSISDVDASDSTQVAVPASNKTASQELVPTAQTIRVRAETLDRLVNEAGEVSISRSRIENQVSGIRTSLTELTDNVARLRSQLREIEIQAETQISAKVAQSRNDSHFDPLEFDRFTRFQELTRMMAESVNDVATVQQTMLRNINDVTMDVTRQAQLTRELQQGLMSVRMVQFGSISDRLYRVVRLASKEADKRVNLDLRGASAEIDRSVLERIVAPLEHLLRNCVGHGIESRRARIEAGKTETGEIVLQVRQEGNEIVIQISDNGAGLNYDKIRARAETAGLVQPDQILSAAELNELIFMPGFSTASEVTALSGRGVGMDIVRAETIALGGRIEVISEPGQGTRFILTLPATLAVTQVVLMSVGDYRFSVPSVLIEQVLQLKPPQLASAYSAKTITFQESPVRFEYLGKMLDLPDVSPVAQRYSPVIVLRSSNNRLAVHVDHIAGNQEVVVKNIGPQLARLNGITGATILGDGEVVLILNPVQLAFANQKRFVANNGVNSTTVSPEDMSDLFAAQATVMVVDDSLTVRKVTQRLLNREGYQSVLAKDGVDGLRQLQDQVPDVILLDVEMPRMDGFDFTRAVRAEAKWKGIPIIMITSRTAEKHRSHAMSLGVNVFLGKPYGEAELLEHIRGFIKEARAKKALAKLH